MSIDFDTVIERRDTHSSKWDMMETLYGVSPDDGLAMWTADMDFRAPQAVTDALAQRVAHGVHGYYGPKTSFHAALDGWMQRRHSYAVDPSWIFETAGTVNGVAKCIQAFSNPGDSVIIFSPVYHVFYKVIANNRRNVLASEMVIRDGQYHMDLDALEQQLTGKERIVLFCSPHNPGGRVWSIAEIRALGEFCAKHDLILVSDEVHNDLIMPGEKHTVAPVALPDMLKRVVLLVATTKTFNMAGAELGTALIPDPALRAKFNAVSLANATAINLYGFLMAEAAYRQGDAWLDALLSYLDENRRVFDAAMNAIPGLRSMHLQGTYLAWVDFTATGMDEAELIRRIQRVARIAASHGSSFGPGGTGFMRINLATQRSRVTEAVSRLQDAFGDLQ